MNINKYAGLGLMLVPLQCVTIVAGFIIFIALFLKMLTSKDKKKKTN